jgi:transposase
MYICLIILDVMSYQVNLTDQELVDLKRIKREVKDSKILRRYQCLHMLHTGMKRQDVAELLDVYADTITDWVKIYKSVGLVALGNLKYDGRRPSVLDAHKETIKSYIKSTSVNTISQLQDYLKTELNIEIEHSWLSRYLKKNSVTLIKKQD